VKHLARKSFWEHYDRLPKKDKALADKNFELLKRDPRHPSLQLKKAGRLWSARIGLDFRVLAYDSSEGVQECLSTDGPHRACSALSAV